jgi:hypothetical protein
LVITASIPALFFSVKVFGVSASMQAENKRQSNKVFID